MIPGDMEYERRTQFNAYAESRNKMGLEFRGSLAHLASANRAFTSFLTFIPSHQIRGMEVAF